MSLGQLPDEVLVKILRLALVGKISIPTSVRAHKIYQTYVDSIAVVEEWPENWKEDYLNAQLSKRPARRKMIISPLLLGTCRRWYRLGCCFFYQSNTFVMMHRDFEPFAKQIGFQNSTHLRSVELAVHYKDPNPAPKVSFLRKAYLKQITSVNVILAKRYSIQIGHDEPHKAATWDKFGLVMRRKAQELMLNMRMQKRQGAHWQVVKTDDWAGVHPKADRGVVSSMWMLEKIPMPHKVRVRNKAITKTNSMLQMAKENVVLDEMDVPEGSGANQGDSTELKDLDGSILDSALQLQT